ncbi:hypothetical protein BVG19_g1940 [[Candida] boidinii]|nr:hypothetical protein BVG19_g1940 [[Candida] boidinii]OWB51609.1 hypothetical protein B5S27_g3174 [[Candida] boidinii]OWB83718.1 hypothetical protein B5S33_g2349 [[Candida] boidinii]
MELSTLVHSQTRISLPPPKLLNITPPASPFDTTKISSNMYKPQLQSVPIKVVPAPPHAPVQQYSLYQPMKTLQSPQPQRVSTPSSSSSSSIKLPSIKDILNSSVFNGPTEIAQPVPVQPVQVQSVKNLHSYRSNSSPQLSTPIPSRSHSATSMSSQGSNTYYQPQQSQHYSHHHSHLIHNPQQPQQSQQLAHPVPQRMYSEPEAEFKGPQSAPSFEHRSSFPSYLLNISQQQQQQAQQQEYKYVTRSNPQPQPQQQQQPSEIQQSQQQLPQSPMSDAGSITSSHYISPIHQQQNTGNNSYKSIIMVSNEKNQSSLINNKKKRANLPKQTTVVLLSWLNEHLDHPYPNSKEKVELMYQTGLSSQQLSNWFINARRRKINLLREIRSNTTEAN